MFLHKELIILAIIITICFTPIILQPNFIDGDSYYYLNQVCNNSQPVNDSSVLFPSLIQFFPCDFVLIKIYLLLICIACFITLGYIGYLFNHEHGYLVAYIAFALTFFTTEFFKFENDSIGYLLGLIGLYFLLKCFTKPYLKNNKQNLILGTAFLLIAALFWSGAVYWFVFSSFFTPIIFFPSVIIMIVFYHKFFGFINPQQGVWEHVLGMSLVYWGLTIFTIWASIKLNYKIILFGFFCLIIGFLVSKLYVLAIPFMALTCFFGLKVLFKNNFYVLKILLITLSLFIILFWNINYSYQFPTHSDLDLIKEAVTLDKDLQNSFGAGHIIRFYGSTPSSAFGLSDNDFNQEGYLVLEKAYDSNCLKLRESTYLNLFYCK